LGTSTKILFCVSVDNSNVTETGSPSQQSHGRPVRAWTVHAGNQTFLIMILIKDSSYN